MPGVSYIFLSWGTHLSLADYNRSSHPLPKFGTGKTTEFAELIVVVRHWACSPSYFWSFYSVSSDFRDLACFKNRESLMEPVGWEDEESEDNLGA